jgi:YVTN family beta-propeller protein
MDRFARTCSLATLATLSTLSTLATLAAGCSGSPTNTASSGDAGDGGAESSYSQDPIDYLTPDESCALNCTANCEPAGYQCEAIADYALVPHADACGAWNGTFPAVSGACTASAPSGLASEYAGASKSDPTTLVLPTGQRVTPVGKVSTFTDFHGQFPASVAVVHGTPYVVVVDTGIDDQSVRLVDTTQIGGTATPVVGSEKFGSNAGVNFGLAVVPDPTVSTTQRAYVAADDGHVYVYVIDTVAKTFVHDGTHDLTMDGVTGVGDGGGFDKQQLLSGIAVTPDGKRLLAGTGNNAGTSPLVIFDIDPTSATNGKALGAISLGGSEIYGIFVNPADTAGQYAYVSLWDSNVVAIVDLVAKSVIKTIPVGKNPQQVVALDARYLAVASSDADEIGILDTLPTAGSEVAKFSVTGADGLHGYSPSALAYDTTTSTLYATLAGMNVVEAFSVMSSAGAPPSLASIGLLRAGWWPTGVAVTDDASVVIVDGKGRGTGANDQMFGLGQGDITSLMQGMVQIVPTPTPTLFTSEQSAYQATADQSQLPGVPSVTCPTSTYDFPVPATNTSGPSAQITHVVFVVKENKTFDGIMGDLPGLEGNADYVFAPGQMDTIFPNQRAIAKAFTNFDNYYTSAEQSIQGHVWTTFGRTTDFIERSWLVAWGRGLREPVEGINSVARPVEGSVFDWLQLNRIPFDDDGELVGAANDDGEMPQNCCTNTQYPGRFYAMDEPDTTKGCYVAARSRITCDLKPFSYLVMPNDHTAGVSPGIPTPETYIAVGDEGLGILLDGLSHSPLWSSTLLIVTEDDPQDGGDHIDAHRTPLYMAGPWIKRGYVSKGHYDTSAIHKLLAHLYGKPYRSEAVARAAVPFDAFTSTPDFTPFVHIPRAVAPTCTPATSTSKLATEAKMSRWNFKEPDQAPGIGDHLWRYFHGEGAVKPVTPGRVADDDDDDDGK